MADSKKVKVELIRSTIGQKSDLIKTVNALGLRKIGDVREHNDSPALQGMIFKVKHLVSVTDVQE